MTLFRIIINYTLLLFALNTYSQIVITNHDVTVLNTLPSDWTIGNGCDVDNFIDVFVIGDLTLKGNCYLDNAKLTIYGEVIYNGYTITSKCSNDELIILGTLSVSNERKNDVRVYPNPVIDFIYTNIRERYSLSIYDLSGKLVSNDNDVRNLSTGLYLVILQTEERYYSTKIIKK